MVFGGMIVARSGGVACWNSADLERGLRWASLSLNSGRRMRAAIRARLARRVIRKDDLERCGVSVAEGDPSIVSFEAHQTAFIRGVLSWRRGTVHPIDC